MFRTNLTADLASLLQNHKIVPETEQKNWRATRSGCLTNGLVQKHPKPQYPKIHWSIINGHSRILNWRYLPYIFGLYKAYVREYHHKIWPYMVQYLQFRILEFPLISFSSSFDGRNSIPHSWANPISENNGDCLVVKQTRKPQETVTLGPEGSTLGRNLVPVASDSHICSKDGSDQPHLLQGYLHELPALLPLPLACQAQAKTHIHPHFCCLNMHLWFVKSQFLLVRND
jgi:hypothetical protein